MNVLITGGTGFIGSRLALECVRRRHTVTIFGQENTGAEAANLALLEQHGAGVVRGSVTDRAALAHAVTGVELVFHLAAAQHEMNVPDAHFRAVNVAGTQNVLETSLVAGVCRVVHGSTIGVYGSIDGEIDETSACRPDNIYGITKLEGEKLALSFAGRIPVTAIRIPEVYGPGDRRLLKLFRAIARERFPIIGTGRNRHHPIYVDDLVEGLLLAGTHPAAPGEVFLLAGKDWVTTSDMVNAIAEALGVAPPRLRIPLGPLLVAAVVLETTLRPLGIQPPLHRRRMDFFRKSFTLRATRATDRLGFEPQTDFRAGARATAAWYRTQNLL